MKIHCQLTFGIDSWGGQESTEESGGKRGGTSLAVQTEKSGEEQISVCLMCCSVTWIDVGFLPCSVC